MRPLENSVLKRPWTCHKADYRMAYVVEVEVGGDVFIKHLTIRNSWIMVRTEKVIFFHQIKNPCSLRMSIALSTRARYWTT